MLARSKGWLLMFLLLGATPALGANYQVGIYECVVDIENEPCFWPTPLTILLLSPMSQVSQMSQVDILRCRGILIDANLRRWQAMCGDGLEERKPDTVSQTRFPYYATRPPGRAHRP